MITFKSRIPGVYHFVFIFSLLTITLLTAWWAIFIHRSIRQAHELNHEKLLMSMDLHALSLGRDKDRRPEIGIYKRDRRFEILATAGGPGESYRDFHRLAPYWEHLSIRPNPSYLQDLEKQRDTRLLMVIGEGGLLTLLLLVSGVMIYRMAWLERRTTHELHELWSRVSHEIKTPITGLKAFLETLQRELLTREEMGPLVELALKQVERQRKLAENMLIGQKLKKEGIGINLKTIGLHEFIQSYFRDHPFQLSGISAGKIKIPGPESREIAVKGDSEALHIIFDNLIDNAVKYAGDTLELSVEVKSQGKKAVVIFKDNGPGFDAGQKEVIFKAYGRLETELPRGQHGTGMGLHISRQLARRMNGDLVADSPGKGLGAQFKLYLEIHHGG